MSWQSISVGILSAINADTGSGGLRNVASPLITAAYNTMGPETPTLPYVVFSMVSEREDKDYGAARAIDYLIQFDIYVDKNAATTSLYAIADRLRTVLDRVVVTAGGATWTARQMRRVGGLPIEFDDQILRKVEEYRVVLVG